VKTTGTTRECYEKQENITWPKKAPRTAHVADITNNATRILKKSGSEHNTFCIRKHGVNRQSNRGEGYIVLNNKPNMPVTITAERPTGPPETVSSAEARDPLRQSVRIALPSTDSISVDYLQAHAARMAASQERDPREYLRDLEPVVLRGTYHRVLRIANSMRLACLYNSGDRIWRRLVVGPQNTMLVGGRVALDLRSCLMR
jgi:hypothetical protein